MPPVALVPLLIGVMLALSACAPAKGGIVIVENGRGTGFTMEYVKWSAENKCELSLNGNDVLQIEVQREEGEIALTVCGKRGSEPYTGKDLNAGIFTVSVSETDEYAVKITGRNATGKVTVQNLGSGAD